MKIDMTILVLISTGVVVLVSLLVAHKMPSVSFDLFDLLRENGRVSKISVAFMLVLGVTTWLIIHLTLHDKMTEGYLTSYGMMWVAPLVARVVFQKTEMPTNQLGGSAPPSPSEAGNGNAAG